MPEQPGLDVLTLERLLQERVVEQVDLPNREVVRGPPVGVELAELVRRERCLPRPGNRPKAWWPWGVLASSASRPSIASVTGLPWLIRSTSWLTATGPGCGFSRHTDDYTFRPAPIWYSSGIRIDMAVRIPGVFCDLLPRSAMEPSVEEPTMVMGDSTARLRPDVVPLYTLAAAVACAAGGWYLLKELAPLLRPLILAVFLAYTILPAHPRCAGGSPRSSPVRSWPCSWPRWFSGWPWSSTATSWTSSPSYPF